MKTRLLKLCTIGLLVVAQSNLSLNAQTVSTIETLTLSPNSYWNGSTMTLGTTFNSGDAIFQNYYDTAYGGYWSDGWAYCNMKDSTTAGYTNEYSARPAGGYNGSVNYLVGKDGAKVNLGSAAIGRPVKGFYVTNGTYAAISMKDGDGFAKKFGGASKNDPDWFKLTVRKWLGGVMTNDSVTFYLADYRFTNNASDYIVKTWQWVDLSSLGNVDSLKFILSSSDMGLYGMNTPAFFCMDNFNSAYDVPATFAPPAGQVGSTAIQADSSVFVSWANGSTVTRGYQDISNTSLGYATVGEDSMALGKAGSNGVISLGDGGSAILTFIHPIKNGTGPDFAVFENSFSDTFLELAFVEVSSDGTNYYRFPATSYSYNSVQVGLAGSVDATKINNLAGKYRALYGTPFDLQELASQSGLNVDSITHIKIIDVVGSIQNAYATRDQYGNKINDPWSTPFASSGFDLDAVGVINQRTDVTTAINELSSVSIKLNVFPNPLQDRAIVQYYLNINSNVLISITDITGNTVYQNQKNNQSQGWQSITISDLNLNNGIYFLKVESNNGNEVQKIIISK